MDAEFYTIVVAEVELGKVAVQVLLSAVLIDTLHAPLEGAEEALNGVGMDLAANILLSGVVHHLRCSAD